MKAELFIPLLIGLCDGEIHDTIWQVENAYKEELSAIESRFSGLQFLSVEYVVDEGDFAMVIASFTGGASGKLVWPFFIHAGTSRIAGFDKVFIHCAESLSSEEIQELYKLTELMMDVLRDLLASDSEVELLGQELKLRSINSRALIDEMEEREKNLAFEDLFFSVNFRLAAKIDTIGGGPIEDLPEPIDTVLSDCEIAAFYILDFRLLLINSDDPLWDYPRIEKAIRFLEEIGAEKTAANLTKLGEEFSRITDEKGWLGWEKAIELRRSYLTGCESAEELSILIHRYLVTSGIVEDSP